jgi:hypothetical protein
MLIFGFIDTRKKTITTERLPLRHYIIEHQTAIGATHAWLGGLEDSDVTVVVVRPDCYVGGISHWEFGAQAAGQQAVVWLDEYFGGFLEA